MSAVAVTYPKGAIRYARTLLALAIVLVLTALLAVAFPMRAHASYNDYDNANPAQQDLGAYGAIIQGYDIPNGVYEVGARTSSRMCILYKTAGEANGHANPERCQIVVQDGQITAVFYLSGAYTRMYMGSAVAASEMTNAEGTDDSAYMAGDPVDGYAPHLYTMAIPALNYPMQIATFDGGSKSVEEGKWFARDIVFTPSEELLVALARQGVEDEGDATAVVVIPEEEGYWDSDDDSGEGAGPVVPDNTDDGSDSKNDNAKPNTKPASGASQATNEAEKSEASAESVEQMIIESQQNGRRGLLVTPAMLDLSEVDASASFVEAVQDKPGFVWGMGHTVALGILIAASLGALWRVTTFALARRAASA